MIGMCFPSFWRCGNDATSRAHCLSIIMCRFVRVKKSAPFKIYERIEAAVLFDGAFCGKRGALCRRDLKKAVCVVFYFCEDCILLNII